MSSPHTQTSTPTPTIPHRQIRAHRPSPSTITVYQAYNAAIASAAVSSQILSSSPLFKPSRMTWIKPSWCWVCYRSGYGHKDSNQSRILALEMTVDGFRSLLERGVLAHEAGGKDEVRVQWDPERGPRLERLGYRSVQIGIPGQLVEKWVKEWIVGIEDVTDRAKAMQKAVTEDGSIDVGGLVQRDLHPVEVPFEVDEEVEAQLQMHQTE